MNSVDSKAVSAGFRMRGLWLASTALVGIRILPQPAPAVPGLAASPSLLQARMARLLALAVEPTASLLARLNPLRSARVRKVRPAPQIGRRRKWREAALAAAASVLLTAASTAHAQTWNGTTSDYNTDGNWSPNGAPIASGQSATFANTGSATVNVSAPIAPDAWTFDSSAQSYTITGAGVNFGGAGITNNAAAGTSISIANVIGGTGGVTQAGGGILTLSGANTYTGGTSVTGGTLNVAGSHAGPVTISNGATLRVAAGGALSRAGAPIVGGSGTFTIVNLGSMTNTGSSNVNTNATVSLITGAGSMLTSDTFEAFAAAGAGSQVVNAAGATIQGGSDTQYGRVFLGNSATVTNYGTIAGSATLAGGNGTSATLVAGTNSIVDLYAGSTTGTVRLGTGSTLSLYTGSGDAALAVTAPDPVTGEAITLRGTGARDAAVVGDIALGAGSTLALRGTGDGIGTNGAAGLFSGALSGAVALAKSDSGTFVLTGANTYTGGTTISGGILQLGNGGTTGAIAGNVVLANNAELTFNRSNAVTFAGAISGSGPINQIGAGTTTLTGANTYIGDTRILAGTLQIGNGGTSGALGTGNVANLGTLVFNRSDAVTFGGVIGNVGSVRQVGAGTTTLTGDNAYSGGTVFGGGVLNAGSAGALGNSGALSFAGGTLQYSAANTTDYSSRFSTAANQAYRIDTNGRDVTYATGLTSQGGTLTKLGFGTLTLTGASTYAGATTISAGTLQVGTGGTSGSLAAASDVSVAASATLALNRTGTLAFGNAVSGAGALTVRGGSTAEDLITLSGALRQTGGFTVANAANVTLSGSYDATNSIVLAGGGTFTNQGTVNAANDAILTSTSANTAVVNAAGGRIEGGFSGVIQVQQGVPGALAVTNSGLIRGIGYDGLTQHGTGALTVTNDGTGIIYGQNDTASGNGYGVGSDRGGVLTLTNAAGGKIVGQYGVVGSNVGDRVTNAGTIAAGFYDGTSGAVTAGRLAGVELRAGGTVTNQAGGLIEGGQRGIVTQGGSTLRVDNAGTVTAGSDVGIQSLGTGNALTVVNRAGGSVTGSTAGVYAGDGANQGNTITLVNAGTIAATNGTGVGGGGGSGLFSITNANGAAIRGGGTGAFAQGIQLNAAAGSTVDNYGTITAGAGTPNAINSTNNAYAINLYAGSTVNGGITLGSGADTVALYTGTGTANTNAVTVADPVLGGENTVTVRTAGTHAAAVFGAIDLGGGANTLSLRGKGDGTELNGAAGTLALGTVSGAGTFDKLDAGTWTLTGQTAVPQTGMIANVRGGVLAINGTFGDTATNSATVNVMDGGTLHGSGTVAGSVNIASGGTVSAGNSPGTLTVGGNYTLNSGSTSLFELGAPGTPGGSSNDLINVGGNLTLGGTLSLVSATNAPVSGAYRLYNYGGTLSGSFASVATPAPAAGAQASSAVVYTNIPNQVNVLLTNGNQSVQYFDGTDTNGTSAGGQGGTAAWTTTATNWTGSPTSRVNDVWRSGVGIFGGGAGTVTVSGAQNVQGLQFSTDGYALGGSGTLNLTGDAFTTAGQSFVNVDAGVGATIATALISTGGAIGLRKLGDGTLTLTGVNTYTGATTVEAGTLAVAAGGSIASAVTNRATLTSAGTLSGGLTNTGTVTASAGRIDGAIANDAGTVTISGTVASNGTFTNAEEATLAIAGSGAYSLDGLLSNAGSLTVASGGRLTAPGGIVNSGTLTVAAGGTVVDALLNTGTLTNAGTYVADATNAAGATLTNTGTFSTVTQPFQNAGTLVTTGVLNGGLSNTGSTQASGQLNGAVSNTGSLALTGATSGVTRLTNDGVADLGGTSFTVGSLSGTNTGAVLRNGRLTAGGDDSSTSYAGRIVDGASATSLTKTGNGSLTLTGTNTYTGGTTIAAGTLVASAASLGAGPVTNNTALVLSQADDATLSDTIGGTGTFTKRGAGTLTYTGTATLTGATTVAEGGLAVNGSLAASPVTVASGAALGGSGTVGSVSIASGARLAPGAGLAAGNVGTLNVAGNLLFSSGSIYQVDATAAGTSDRVNAAGRATLQGGTVQVTAGAGQYAPSTRYTILSAAGGLSGRFAGVTSNFAFLTPFLTYDANDAYLRLARNDLQFRAVAATRNQGNVAGAAQATGVGTPLYDGIAVLSASQARQAFDALSGEVHSSGMTAQFATAEIVREAILDRLRFGELPSFAASQGIGQRFASGTTLPALYTADLPGRSSAPTPVTTQVALPQPVSVWGQGFGSFGTVGGDGNAARLSLQTSGFVLGADSRIDNAWRVGVAGGYTFTALDVTARQSTGTVESGFGSLYAGGSFGPAQLRLGGAYAGSNVATSRAVIFPGFGENESARYGAVLGQAFGELGYRIGTGAGYVEPFVGGAAIRISRDGFTERGGAAALTAQGERYDVATTTAGIQAQGDLGGVLGTETPILVRGLIGYRRAYGDVVPSTLFAFGAAGQSFLTSGVPVARDALVAQAGLDWRMAPSTTLSLSYTGQVGTERTQVHGVKGGFAYSW